MEVGELQQLTNGNVTQSLYGIKILLKSGHLCSTLKWVILLGHEKKGSHTRHCLGMHRWGKDEDNGM